MLTGPLLAQSSTGASIIGKVTDPDNRPIAGVQVYLKGTSHGMTSDSAGQYRLLTIQPGQYSLIFQGMNYESVVRPITMTAGQTQEINEVLKPNARQLNEVTIKAKTQAEELKESAKAVDLIETKEIKLKSVDLSEVLAQTKGVNVRRSGGLGSEARFSLNGLTDDQIRFFMDEVPLAFSGYSFGFANVPVNLVERIEIYKGVVPIRFGADALGGAVNIVTPVSSQGTHGAVSYQTGSFATHRLALSGQYTNNTSGLFARVAGFWDYAKNNYKVDVQVADDKGRLNDVTVSRFHDGYTAKGVNAEIGLKNKSWAKQVSLKVFGSDFFKELQNNNVMTIPYGDVVYGEKTKGVSARYKQYLGKKVGLDYVMGYSFSETRFTDTSAYVYDWFGNRVTKRVQTGEINNASDQFLWEKSRYARLNGDYILREGHVLRVSSAPTFVTRTGDELRQTNPGGRDPLTAQRTLFTWVNGLEYEFTNQNAKLQNFVFVKHYSQQQRSEEPLPGGEFRQRNRSSAYSGIGNSVRYTLSERMRIKASYEWATRLPNPDEIFGDGALTLSNLYLEPERSHNGNLEVSLVNKSTAKSTWNASINGFVRAAQNLIVLLGTDKLFGYQNVFSANSIGAEVAAGWLTLNNRLSIEGNFTWQNFRNASSDGSFATYQGDRIPNMPYQMANGSASYRLPKLFRVNDELSFFWNARYVYQFYRGWESAGLKEYKQVVPTQFVNNIGFTYKLPIKQLNNALTGEIQNLANAKVYDNFGVQKPGRAFYLKITTQF
jgi:outer membrane cobalamin receptor